LSVLEYCLEKSSIVLELPRGWKVVQLISLEVEIIWKCKSNLCRAERTLRCDLKTEVDFVPRGTDFEM
jgi:hypothetical protein